MPYHFFRGSPSQLGLRVRCVPTPQIWTKNMVLICRRSDFLQLHCRPKTSPSAFASIKSSNLTSLSQNPASAAFVPQGNLPGVPISIRVDMSKSPGTNCISLRNGAFTGSCWYGLVIPILGRTVRGLVALTPLCSRYLFRLETIRSNSSNNGPSIPGKTVVSVPSLVCENGKRGTMFCGKRVFGWSSNISHLSTARIFPRKTVGADAVF